MDKIRESKECRFGFATQAVFVTPAGDADAVTEVSVEAFDIEDGTKRHEIAGVYGSKNVTKLNTSYSTTGVISNFTTVGAVNLDTVDHFLYAHFQNVLEFDDTQFTKAFHYFTVQPDFSLDEGHFLTWFKLFPDASSSYKLGSCIVNSFKLSGERDGLIMLDCGWKGLGVPSVVSNPSGVWTINSGDNFVEFNSMTSATLTIADASPFNIILKSFEVESSYTVAGVGQDATDGLQSYGIFDRKGKFTVVVLRDTNVTDIVNATRTGDMVTLAIDLGAMTIQATGQLESKNDSADGLATITLNCKMSAEISTLGVVDDSGMLEIVVRNSHDRSWPSA